MFWRSPAWDEVRYVALDLETSGLRPKIDEIIAVATIPIRDGVIHYGERFYSLVRPPDLASLPADGIGAHHILPSELADAPSLADLLPAIDERLREGILLLHFSHLDLGFLKEAYQRSRLAWPKPKVVDTVKLLLELSHRQQRFSPHPVPPRTALPAARFQLGLPHYRHHHALSDALATAELFLALRARLGARTLRELS
ncbi:MAG: 3'-5' exonuclease [Acidobacteria bacterium]|jgi:DNA polymerase-3 subunit epsilon|nr:3'-5' exonuclease [Acidobacteriota bacterium]MCU0254365.1 3'-5' exonuclease [Acidobacteriota bacterium]